MPPSARFGSLRIRGASRRRRDTTIVRDATDAAAQILLQSGPTYRTRRCHSRHRSRISQCAIWHGGLWAHANTDESGKALHAAITGERGRSGKEARHEALENPYGDGRPSAVARLGTVQDRLVFHRARPAQPGANRRSDGHAGRLALSTKSTASLALHCPAKLRQSRHILLTKM